MVNIDLLEATMQAIEANPDAHDQDDWYYHGECGTTYCFAGHAALLAGAPQPPDAENNLSWRVPPELLGSRLVDDGIQLYVASALGRDGLLSVQDFAFISLGINTAQRQYLFTSAETPQELRTLVDLIKADPKIGSPGLYDAFYEEDED